MVLPVCIASSLAGRSSPAVGKPDRMQDLVQQRSALSADRDIYVNNDLVELIQGVAESTLVKLRVLLARSLNDLPDLCTNLDCLDHAAGNFSSSTM